MMDSSQQPLKILSLDGGGIRGLSSLLILEKIMENIRDKYGLQDVPRPCEHFDLIGGTSTGGIIAIMLGRLHMSVEECIKAYRDIAKSAFSLKSTPENQSKFRRKLVSKFMSRSARDVSMSTSPAFSAKNLENAMKSVIRSFCVEADCRARRENGQSTAGTCPHEDMLYRNENCTKTVVLAITKDNVDAPPTLLTSYDSSTAFETCTIWQVARATSAAVGFFESINLGRDGIDFVDASFGYNNPCEVLIQEAQEQFPERRQMRILSIGTGLGDVITIKDSPEAIISALSNMATSSKRVAHSLYKRYDDDQYFRFNVDHGLKDITLSDWEKSSTISAHTRNYLAENERAIRRFVDCLFTKGSTGVEERSSAASRVHFSVPFGRNKNFVGREAIMEQLLANVPPNADPDDCQRTAIVGLGGVGKTQIALEIAFRIREKHPDCSVFWVPAIDAVSFRNAYRHIGQLLGIDGINDDKVDVEDLVNRALSRESSGNWLLIVDNADNPDLFFDNTNLVDHLPFSRQGSLLFTSRNHELMVGLGVLGANILDVEGMSEDEGFKFFETHLSKRLMSNREDTARLLDVLGYLPLAIRQASAYMAQKQMSTTRYLKLCQSSDQYMVELLSRHFEDTHRYKEAQNAIATTLLISFRQLEDNDPLASNYLKFMSFLSEKAIPRSILPVNTSALEVEDAIGTLKGYAFITERETTEATEKYDIHRLVRIAMLNWLDQLGELEEWTTDVIRCIEEAFPRPSHRNRAVWIDYLPHTRWILERETTAKREKASLLFKVGRSFDILGQYREAERMHRRALEERETILEPDHPDTLASISDLGSVLESQGHYEEAEMMYRRALEERELALGPDHPDTLTSVGDLAGVLESQGQHEVAETMYRRVLEGREKSLGPDHPDTISSVESLAIVLENQGHYEKAESMFRRVLEGWEKTLGPDHPNTLNGLLNLGSSLQVQGQYEKAEALYRQALRGQEKELGPEHPDTLASIDGLAIALASQGQYEKAEQLHRRALEGREKVLGPNHPDTLVSVDNLCNTLKRQGRHQEAEAMRRRALG